MSSKCIFCKIAGKEIPSKIVYEDEEVLAFEDIDPQAPVHLVIIPKKHIPTILELEEEEKELIGHLHLIIKKLAREKSIAEKGFRIVSNCKEYGGQAVFHLHFHLLGGRKMGWPPG